MATQLTQAQLTILFGTRDPRELWDIVNDNNDLRGYKKPAVGLVQQPIMYREQLPPRYETILQIYEAHGYRFTGEHGQLCNVTIEGRLNGR